MHIKLLVGKTSSGQPAYESVYVTEVGPHKYVIEFSPGLAYGVAAGDEIELFEDGSFEVVRRAGSVAVRVLSEHLLDSAEPDLTRKVGEILGGRLDGNIGHGLAYTIPHGPGFPAIEQVFEAFVHSTPGAAWEYGNVYAEDGTPLGWWQSAA
ncbi:MAG: DUF4265 domain-containing protein [Rhodocyclaceae bacterium]